MIQTDYPLLSHNTFGMEVHTHCYAEYSSEDELINLLSDANPLPQPLLHIGAGSNLLFRTDYPGTVLHSAIRDMEIVDETDTHILLRVGAGIVWDEFVEYCVRHGWGGIENLSLIPGEVGASAVQNIGAYGVEAKDVIALVETIELATGKRRIFGNAECCYSYRHSIFKHEAMRGKYAVTYVTYRLDKQPQLRLGYGNIRSLLADKADCTIADVRQAIIDIRQTKLPDPKQLGNAGSFFMNPVVERDVFLRIQAQYPDMPYYEVGDSIKIPAGWMIEQCGWKGRSLGRAAVHDKQALVLVNLGGATSDEIVALCEAVRKDVKDKFGVEINPEVNFI